MRRRKGTGERGIPETIEGRWDIFYRDYPEIYDRFGRVPKEPTALEVINQRFPLQGKTVLDVGSGTGLSTFGLATYAQRVIGVEPEAAMREVALCTAEERGVGNIEFLEGWTEDIPLDNGSVDMVVAMTLASLHNEENVVAFIRESERVIRSGGVVLSVNLAPGWYGGDLAPVILEKSREKMGDNVRDKIFSRYGYDFFEYLATQDYGTVENAVETYGFIFGRNAIEYIREHNKMVVTWKVRIHHKRVP